MDLKVFLKEEEERGREVILMIDANEGMKNRTVEIIELINECKLIDVHAKCDPQNGVKLCLGNRNGGIWVEYTNIAPYNEGFVMDHRALVADINTKKLRAGDLQYCERQERALKPEIKMHRVEMFKKMYEISKERSWAERLGKINAENPSQEEDEKFEKIDQEITITMKKQERVR